jgi:tetratricopeptide (TPR) repeat protein
VPARQKTIRGAIAWSYDLLDENEKRVFESLAVFAGGFSLEAAEAVAGNRKNVDAAGKFSDSSKSFETLDVIESLVDKNLLQLLEPSHDRSGAGNEKPRFRFLEAIREFALERLEASGESERLRSRHAEYFLALAEQGEVERRMRDGESGWTRNFRIENDNLRAAFEFLLKNNAEKALKLVTDLHIFWSYNFQLEEGRRLLAEALRKSRNEPSALRGRAYKGAAMLAWKQGDYEEARRLYGETLQIGESRGDKNLIAIAKNGLGIAAYQQNDLSEAKNFFEDALDLARQSDDEILVQSILTGLGEIARIEEDYEAVRRYNSEVEEFARRNGYKNHLCGSLINLGALACEENDCKTARQYFMEAAQIASELKQDVLLTLCFVGFAAVAVEEGDAVRAALLTGAADNLCCKIGYTLETPDRIFREKYLSRLLGLLSEKDFTELIAEGRAMNADEVLALVAANE